MSSKDLLSLFINRFEAINQHWEEILKCKQEMVDINAQILSGRQEETKEKLCATKKILSVKIPGVLLAKMSQGLPAQAAPAAKMSKILHPKVLKVDKKLPVQVSKAPIKPAKASSSTVSLAPAAITKNPFPAPAVYLAALVPVKYLDCSSLLIRVLNKTTSALVPSVAAPVLEPGRQCFLLQGILWYSIQVHAFIHEELVNGRNLGQGLFQGMPGPL